MDHTDNDSHRAKISAEFSTRLGRLGPQQKVRAIIILRTENVREKTGRRQLRVNRQAEIEMIHKSAEQALSSIDGILERFDGKRLADIDALGCIPVETTAAALKALAASEHVKAILEDQAISLLVRARR